MIFFTIIIERKKKSVETSIAEYQQKQTIQAFEEKRFKQNAEYPEYCTRI